MSSLTVSPAIIKLDLSKDKPQTSISYTNNTAQTLELHLSASDFTPVSNDGRFTLTNPIDTNNLDYSLTTWLTFENNTLIIKPGETAITKIFIETHKLPLGGHYASILASPTSLKTNQQISLNPITASLLFVRSPGGQEIYSAQIESFNLNRPLLFLPNSNSLEIQNSGNVEFTPHGKIDVLNNQGEIVSQSILNQTSLMVLPNTFRHYQSGFNQIAKFSPPGIYTAKLQIGYGPKNQSLFREESFFSLGTHPMFFILPPVLLLLFVSFAILRQKLQKPSPHHSR